MFSSFLVTVLVWLESRLKLKVPFLVAFWNLYEFCLGSYNKDPSPTRLSVKFILDHFVEFSWPAIYIITENVPNKQWVFSSMGQHVDWLRCMYLHSNYSKKVPKHYRKVNKNRNTWPTLVTARIIFQSTHKKSQTITKK